MHCLYSKFYLVRNTTYILGPNIINFITRLLDPKHVHCISKKDIKMVEALDINKDSSFWGHLWVEKEICFQRELLS